jgi:GT2 family glycosyltransferase
MADSLLFGRKPAGTIAYTAVNFMLESFGWAYTQLLLLSNEYSPSGTYIHPDHATTSGQINTRNELVTRMQGDWLLQLDSDHDFEPDLAIRMLNLFERHKLDVLVGFYCYKEAPFNPVLFQYVETPDGGEFNGIVDWGSQQEGSRKEDIKLLPIGAAGAGCLLVRRAVFDRITQETGRMPFSAPEGYKNNFDDFNFFEHCRRLGIKCWCAPQIEVAHLRITGYGMSDNVVTEHATQLHVEAIS